MLLIFQGGARVLSQEIGEVLEVYRPYDRLELNKLGKLVLTKKSAWIRRELDKANFGESQTAMLRRLKRDLNEVAVAEKAERFRRAS